MKVFRHILVICLLFVSFNLANAQTDLVKWGTRVEHVGGETYRVFFDASIADGWHMYDMGPYEEGPYPTSFVYELGKGLSLSGRTRAHGKVVKEYDDIFEMEIGWYEKKVSFSQDFTLKAEKATLLATVEWMICNDTSCLPPDDAELTVEIVAVKAPVVETETVAGATVADEDPAAAEGEEPEEMIEGPGEGEEAEAVSEDYAFDGGEPVKGGSGLWAIIIEAILWGFAALLTPCVFPMVPMTVSFFMKDEAGSAIGRFKAIMYGVFIVAIYTIPIAIIILTTRYVGGDQITADIFNWIATHWLPNVIFFIVFLVFAASFFGAFEITLPSWMVNKSDSKSDRKGLGGVFFMALTLVLVSFSCTGPIVSNVIIKSFAGEFWEPILTMLAFSIAFALPFTLFAFFPHLLKKMPKSGGWLNSVKVVLGFIEVALGLKFLSIADQTYHWGILDREVYLAIWIVVFSLMGLYLLGKITFKHDSPVKYIGVGRLSLVIITFSFVVYMIPGMWGAPLKALSGYLPPIQSQDFILGSTGGGGNESYGSSDGVFINPVTGKAPKHSDFLHMPHGLQGFFDLEEGLEYSRSVGKPVFVDVTGQSCVNCREMEMRVWSDPLVLDMLRNDYVIVALYLDDKKTLPEKDWVTTESGRVYKTLGKINSHWTQTHYGTVAQPYYILLDNDGKTMVPPRGYDLNIEAYQNFLKSGLEAYKR